MHLTLQIHRCDSVALDHPEPSLPRVDVWREHDGSICAYGYTHQEQQWMLMRGVALFCFSAHTDVVQALAPYAIAESRIRDTFHRCVLPMALQVRGHEVLHASGVRAPQGVLALCAASETGKSTLAYGLSQRSYSLWADDAVAFDASTRPISVLPIPFQIRLRPTSAAYFGLARASIGGGVAPQPAAAIVAQGPTPLAALCILRQIKTSPHQAPRMRRLPLNEAFPAVLEHAYCFTLSDLPRKRRMLQQYLDLISHVPAFELCFGTGLELLPATLDCLERTLGTSIPIQSARFGGETPLL